MGVREYIAPDVRTIDVSYFGHTVALPDLPEYRKFYLRLAARSWEPGTFRVLERHLDRETVFVDIGAWIGVTPFYAAEIAKSVVAVDPDPKCAALLQRLAQRLPNVTVLAGALSDRRSVSVHAVKGFGSSETSVLPIGNGECATAEGFSLREIMEHAEGAPCMVKVDIEGYEYEMAQQLAQLSGYPAKALQIAVHPELFERTLAGGRVMRRLRTALATWRLGRMFKPQFCGPSLVHYPGLHSYIAFGIILRSRPKGADLVFEQRT
ncbi:FkbM family methyltransferase [Pseudaminobacter sp. 19-2017]|uniref:FkbM family methyltransferase n=1 Tax=Pseudaminobacter soli (ex Zhang et al. 2022) TaxID=2831468 RepID=A0A942DZN2_9HYPH|nr:FkbM family methyltransferase [Pseudaminobacter soli]MBS3650107.1 FkbM family methyltransferase [Pseudaminobacter soli]